MIFPYFIVLVIILIFRQWFIPGYIAGGDLWPMARRAIESFSLYPYAWNSALGGGLGLSTIPYLWNHFQYALPLVILGEKLHLSWDLIVRLGYLFPFLLVSIISSYRFGKHFVGNQWAWLTSLIFVTNTYSILLIAGGQTGVAMAYAFSPLVLLRFIQSIDRLHKQRSTHKKEFIGNGLLLSLLIVFDLRIAYVIISTVFFYMLLRFFTDRLYLREIVYSAIYTVLVPLMIAIALHSYWIVPALIYQGRATDIGRAYTDASILKFFSFADFSHALSLLHPNWPENIFGKVYLLQPEFLVLPVLAFASLLFGGQRTINNKQNVFSASCLLSIRFFAFLALLGAFLAKGTHEPFGNVYKWMFTNVSGFVMFRDPTKWYILTAISYSVLIPFALLQLSELFRNQKLMASSKGKSILLFTAFLVYWLFTIRQGVAGDIKGTLQRTVVPKDYLLFEKILAKDQLFSRTLWIPSVHRLSFQTGNHPAVDATTVTKESSISGVLSWIGKPSAKEQLSRWAVQYVVIPIDTVGEMFTTDRAYDDKKRREAIQALDEILWLERDTAYTQLGVWKIQYPVGRFWKDSNTLLLSKRINPVLYALSSVNLHTGDRVTFSETFNPLWYVKLGKRMLYSSATKDGLNEFIITEPFAGSISVGFLPQQSVDIGVKIGIAILSILFVLLRFV